MTERKEEEDEKKAESRGKVTKRTKYQYSQLERREGLYLKRISLLRHTHFTGRRPGDAYLQKERELQKPMYSKLVHMQLSRDPPVDLCHWGILISQREERNPSSSRHMGTTRDGYWSKLIIVSKICLPWLLSLLGNLTPYSPGAQEHREEKTKSITKHTLGK